MTTGEFVGVMLTGIALLAGQVILEVRTMDLRTRLVAFEKQYEAEPRYLRMGECQMPPMWCEEPVATAHNLDDMIVVLREMLEAAELAKGLRQEGCRALDEAEMPGETK